MENRWQFLINGIEVEEPIGFDAIVINLQRDTIYHGLENIFSDNITFWDLGAQLIRDEYELNGIDGQLEFVINYSCDGGITYTEFISGILNCFFYVVENNIVTIKIEPSGFHRNVKNRLNTPINLMSNTSIDGLPMSTIDPFDLGLHSKAIVKQASNKTNPFINPFSDFHTFPPVFRFNRIEFPFQTVLDELQTINESSTIITFEAPPLATTSGTPNFSITETGENIEVKYNLKGSFVHFCPDNTQFQFALFSAHGTDATQNQITYQSSTHINTGGTTQTINFNYQGTLSVPAIPGTHIWFLITIFNYQNTNTVSPSDSSFTINLDPDAGLEFKQSTIEDPSTAKSFLIHEAFAKIAESITGITDSFRSDFLGQPNSLPHSYSSAGCGAYTAISNGLNIRKMLDKNGDNFPIITSFNDLFNASNAVWNLGMRIEKDNTGKEFIRVEPKSFFYNSNTILSAFELSDLKRSPAQELIYNTSKVGYQKWNLNITGSNALDEFNSTRNYSLPVKKANTNIDIISKFIGSGYLIEQTRRLQYLSAPTNDFETDNDIFFICANRDSVTTDLYTTPPVSTTYPAGTVSERDEDFTGITNLLSPETSYNLRISPIRIASNWYNYLAASIWKHPTDAIKFISGEGNYQEGDALTGDCIVIETVTQNQDLLASELREDFGTPIYLPEFLEFSYPLSYNQFINIINNSEKAIAVSCNSNIGFVGFIKSLKFSPTTQGGIGEFILIRGTCPDGDYNIDFNSDFLINSNC